jgi:alkylhydroperoxidase family enzyme
MARIPYPQAPESPRLQWLFAGMPPINLLRMERWAEGIVESIVRLSDAVLNRSEVDDTLRQIAFLRLCTCIGAEYEFHLLAKVSRTKGLSETLIAAAAEGSSSPGLSEGQQMSARLAEELAVQTRASEEVFEYLRARLPPRHLVELVIGIGFYLMQSRVIGTFDIEKEDVEFALGSSREPSPGLQAWREGRL